MSQSMKYKINEIFFSMQGEGFNQGKEVVFIRLSGCNLKCSWCDTNHHTFEEKSISEIIAIINSHSCKSVIITGGEPITHNLLTLLIELKKNSIWIAIESNGTIKPSEEILAHIDYIAVSPKGETALTAVNEVRVVNTSLSADFLSSIESKIKADNYFISPLDSNGKMNIEESLALLGKINSISSKKWRMSLQLHKFAGIR